ncbi:dynein axonemal heavy chain 12-like [Phyllobates terribilis]|uniref:dynein axonemal heavy chain 12-like n=1 Tax=Phyllobates terribilis TaxID=111132 RepID=UPI003CCAE0C4
MTYGITVRDLLQETVETYVRLFDLIDVQFLPVFKMQLTFDDEKMDFYPSFQDVEEVILFILTPISKTLQNIQTVQPWLSGSNTVQIIEAKLPDYIFDSAALKLKEAVSHNLHQPFRHFQTYVESFSWLVDGSAAEKVETFLSEEHSFDEYTEFIEQFHTLARDIMGLPTRAYFTMVHLDCDDLKQGLADKAKSFANILLDRLVTNHRLENEE